MKSKRQLNRNEIERLPSPAVMRAIRGFAFEQSSFYFDGYYGSRLAPELARRFKISQQQVSVGYGAEFFLRALFDGCDPKKDVVLANNPHYSFYSAYAKTKHVRLAVSELLDRGDRFALDRKDFLKKIKKLRPKVILITSPNNPTGNSTPPKDLEAILRAAPKTTLVTLDEAYWGFDENYNEAAVLRLLKKYENFVVLRSFSKRYALAGLRIGFALWGKRAKEIVRYEDPYLGGSRLLEEAAVAALNSEPYYAKLSRELIADRKRFIADVNKLHAFKAYASNANFVLVKVEKGIVLALEKRLKKLDVAISKFVTPEFMRVSLGSRMYIADFVKALRAVDIK